jgi:chemotaxis protein CheY-P-specific phosphatase CheC
MHCLISAAATKWCNQYGITNDAISAAVTNDAISAAVTNDAISMGVTNDTISMVSQMTQ